MSTAENTTPTQARALVVVDVQEDFCEGGSLAVEGGREVARQIGRYLTEHGGEYQLVVATLDWHIDPGHHFADGEPDYVDTWPVHCPAGQTGAAWTKELLDGYIEAGGEAHSMEAVFDAVVRKGEYEAAYSGFEGVDQDGHSLANILTQAGVETVDICGIATSHCVRATAEDALKEGLAVRVVADLAVGVTPELAAGAETALREAGVEVTAVTSR